MVEGRSCGRNNDIAEMGVARAFRILNDTGLLRAADLACVSRPGCSIGFAVCKRAVSGNTCSVQDVDVCCQRRRARAHC